MAGPKLRSERHVASGLGSTGSEKNGAHGRREELLENVQLVVLLLQPNTALCYPSTEHRAPNTEQLRRASVWLPHRSPAVTTFTQTHALKLGRWESANADTKEVSLVDGSVFLNGGKCLGEVGGHDDAGLADSLRGTKRKLEFGHVIVRR